MNTPYGGVLNVFSNLDLSQFLEKTDPKDIARLKLNPRQSCDYEMIQMGAFSPLNGFMNEEDYKGVLSTGRLKSGLLFPLPISLDIGAEYAASLIGKRYLLLESEAQTQPIAVMEIQSIYELNKTKEMETAFGSTDAKHPAVAYLKKCGDFAVGGQLLFASPIPHYDFPELRYTPQQAREFFKSKSWQRIVAFQTRNPVHRAHFELTLRAAEKADAKIFLNPVVGLTKDDDVDPFTRVRCYKHIVKNYGDNGTLGIIPLAMRMAGPNEALLHMIIRKNMGATHFIVGRDHAGPGKDSTGKDFYGPYEAQEKADKYAKEIGIEVLKFEELQYSKTRKKYLEASEIQASDEILKISGTEFRAKLLKGEEIPEWFSFAEVTHELKNSVLPSFEKGLCVFFTGLSGSGKSTLARALQEHLQAKTARTISILDGDELREHICKGLGFSRADREENIHRIAFLAGLVTKHRGIAICSPIAPYENSRVLARNIVSAQGNFILVHVATPLKECERRDPKGLYKKVRAGSIQHFTGIDDPFEDPVSADINIDTSSMTVSDSIEKILSHCREKGFINV